MKVVFSRIKRQISNVESLFHYVVSPSFRPMAYQYNQSAGIRWKSESGERAFEVGKQLGGRNNYSTCHSQYDRLRWASTRPIF